MKAAEIFAGRAIWIQAIAEPNRPDRQFVAQAAAERVTHVIHARLFGSGKKIARIEEERALQLTENRKCVFDIEDRIKLAADRISFWIEWPERPLAKTADAR